MKIEQSQIDCIQNVRFDRLIFSSFVFCFLVLAQIVGFSSINKYVRGILYFVNIHLNVTFCATFV